MESICIGIDLGTTNSVASIKRGSKPEIIQNNENEDSTPSVVGWYKNEKTIGARAVDRMVNAPQDTIISVKRLMGAAFSDKELIDKMKNRYHYEIKAPTDGTEDDLRVVLGGKEYSPIDISAMILEKIKSDTEAKIGKKVEFAVVTVPAYFTEKQKDATRKAALKAGLKVQQILDEPTAAAISYGMDSVGIEENKTILVYDLGGGTFDVSILTIAGGIFAQLDLEGDMFLGGDDFDHRIMDYVISELKKDYDVDPASNPRFMLELKKKCEKAKIALSSSHQTEIVIIGLLQDRKKEVVDVEIEFTRDRFEEMIGDQIQETIKLVQKAITNAGITEEQIDQVLLVGGSSSIPIVRTKLEAMFGPGKISKSVDLMKCVAYGASIMSARLGEQVICSNKHVNPGGSTECRECGEALIDVRDEFITITPTPFGIAKIGDRFDVIIPKGSPYPTAEPIEKTFYTPEANLRRIKVPCYQGESEVASENQLQCTVWLELPANVKEGTPVKVAFRLGKDGILEHIKVALMDGTGTKVEVTPERGGKRDLVEKKMEDAKNKMYAISDQSVVDELDGLYGDAIDATNRNELDKAEKRVDKLIERIEQIESQKVSSNTPGDFEMIQAEILLAKYEWLLDANLSFKIKNANEKVKSAQSKNNKVEMEDAAKELSALLDEVPGMILDLVIYTLIARIQSGNGDITRSNKMFDLLNQITNDIKNNNIDEAVRKKDILTDIFNEIMKENPSPRSGIQLLGDRKTNTTR